VASPSSSTSSIKRLRASASNRLTEGLLASGGRVAGIGLATALITLIFTIWFRVELGYQSEVGAPMARYAADLNAAINRSLAALRGWVAYGDPGAARERVRLWVERIEPTLERLEEISLHSEDPTAQQQVNLLRASLWDLKRIQWAIEDVARTPGNQPAMVAYTKRLEPLRRTILRAVYAVIEQYSSASNADRSVDFLAQLARFRSAFSQGDLALHELLTDYSQVREHEVKNRMQRARALASQIADEARVETRGDLQEEIQFICEEFGAYDVQVQEIVTLRRSDAWNVAQLLFVQEAQPLVIRARELAGELARAQAQASVDSAVTLERASYVVIAMALLMGLISAGSLFVSYRLRQQVENVMAKAKKLGQYVIDERLGKGAMGEVYLAHHAMLRRPTAIKLLRAESAQNLRAQQRFQREVQLTCQLTHPNTVEIFDYGRTPDGIFYYAMEYLDGFTLEALVHLAGPVAPARVVHILIQACGSLAEAHASGLLHRDIKPSNIMLTTRGGVPDTVKILDFGLVKEFTGGVSEPGDAGDVIVGTPMYLAPESILSSESSTPQADLYALGAVGYYLLTGTPVFQTADLNELLSSHLNQEPEFPSQRLGQVLPEDLEYIIMACLAKNPSERPASAGALAEMLRACDAGQWSPEDARLWWEEYGESARAEISVDETGGSLVRTGLEVVVASTRG
jgi:tRNA A-37 threonylcarbamoyl transferase component Bud32